MAFWENLAKYALMAAPYAAAPFTGGASTALIGAAAGAGNALLSGGDGKDALLAGGMGALPGLTGGLNEAAQAGLQAGASGGLSALANGGAAPDAGMMPPPPTTPAAPPIQTQGGGFWSKLAEQAKQGMKQRDFWTTAAQSVAGGLAAHQANKPTMADVQRLEYIRGGGTGGGRLGLTQRTTKREQEEAEKRLNGGGFWENFLTYGVTPGLALYGSLLPPNQPKGAK